MNDAVMEKLLCFLNRTIFLIKIRSAKRPFEISKNFNLPKNKIL